MKDHSSDPVVHWSPYESVLDFDMVHVWFCDLDDGRHSGTFDESILSPDERERADGLKSTVARLRFVERCSFIRQTLGVLAGIAPERLEFLSGFHGKPLLTRTAGSGGPREIRFNVSHSENILALAVSFDRELGIDIEVVNPIGDEITLAGSYFHPEEIERLVALPQRERCTGFYRLWTREEAVAKLSGRALAGRSSPATMSTGVYSEHPIEITVGGKTIVGTLALGGEAVLAEPSFLLAGRNHQPG
jgi:4'-phosphopantetheinyl transferase